MMGGVEVSSDVAPPPSTAIGMDSADALPDPPPVLALRGITKTFPGVTALDDVGFTLGRGEIRALVGENGAGKSTLMKVLSGAYAADGGTIEVFGETVERPDPAGMIERGVAVIYQELAQAPHLSVAENVLMGRLPRRGGFVDWPAARRLARDTVHRLGFEMDPAARVAELSVARRQMVEIAKAIAREARIIVLDEPSAVLAQAEIDQLFGIMRQLAGQGVSFVYISHRLREVFEIGDTVTILRDGRVVHDGPSSEMTTDGLISGMVGRDVGDQFPTRNTAHGDVVLSAEGVSSEGLLDDVSIELRAGEIVGLFGLVGAGRTELLRTLYGVDRASAGRVAVEGVPVTRGSARDGIRRGLGLVPEDRKSQGLFLIQSVSFNILSASLDKASRGGLLSAKLERGLVGTLIERLRIRTPSGATPAGSLSGGNQQKCVIARLVSADCRILLADEPTRGVDVGAKREIYDLLVELAGSRGLAVLVASSELPEILGLTDRLYVMREGRVSAHLVTADTNEEEVMRHAAIH